MPASRPVPQLAASVRKKECATVAAHPRAGKRAPGCGGQTSSSLSSSSSSSSTARPLPLFAQRGSIYTLCIHGSDTGNEWCVLYFANLDRLTAEGLQGSAACAWPVRAPPAFSTLKNCDLDYHTTCPPLSTSVAIPGRGEQDRRIFLKGKDGRPWVEQCNRICAFAASVACPAASVSRP
jgi:hypothetical protein